MSRPTRAHVEMLAALYDYDFGKIVAHLVEEEGQDLAWAANTVQALLSSSSPVRGGSRTPEGAEMEPVTLPEVPAYPARLLAGPLADDAAADHALVEAESRGWFLREREDVFPFFYYWDTPKEMQEYIDETWNDVISINAGLWNDLRSSWATANADARVRLRLKMKITSLRSQNPS